MGSYKYIASTPHAVFMAVIPFATILVVNAHEAPGGDPFPQFPGSTRRCCFSTLSRPGCAENCGAGPCPRRAQTCNEICALSRIQGLLKVVISGAVRLGIEVGGSMVPAQPVLKIVDLLRL